MRIRSWKFVLALSILGATTLRAQGPAPTTIIVVRHAEALADAGRDPALSEVGLNRGRALADAVGSADIRAILVTQYQRTRQTAEVTAADTGAPIVVMAADRDLDAHVNAVVARVFAEYAGRTVLIVGHSNTVPEIVKGFSGVDVGEIAHDSYDNLFIVTAGSAGKGSLVRARYGA